MSLSEDIKAALPIVEEFQRDGHELRRARSQFVCLCPFHEERTPSCYVSPDTGRFKCFGACAAGGTVIDYHALKRGISAADAIKELAARLQLPALAGTSNDQRPLPKVSPSPLPRPLPRLPDLHVGTAIELNTLAVSRNISHEAVSLARDRELVHFCDLNDGPELLRAWVLTDRTRRNAQARRLDGDRWHHQWNADAKDWLLVEPEHRKKVRGFTNNQASWPVGIEEAGPFHKIAIVEGVDLLAAFHFLLAEERKDRVAPVAILGASNRIPEDALALFAGKRVRIFPHVDQNHAGLNAAANWEAQLRPIVERIDAFDFAGLVQSGGADVKDLNDLTNIDPDCFDAERAVWSLMDF
jgi:hypothetical protein